MKYFIWFIILFWIYVFSTTFVLKFGFNLNADKTFYSFLFITLFSLFPFLYIILKHYDKEK